MNSNTFWQSVTGSKKALVSGLAAVLTFVLATLSSNNGGNLTLRQWLVAGGTFVVAHFATWLVSNEGSLPIGKLIGALVANPTVTAAFASLGIVNLPQGVEPVAVPVAIIAATVPADIAPVPDLVTTGIVAEPSLADVSGKHVA